MKLFKKKKLPVYRVKRCPECFIELPLLATKCHSCKSKIGKVMPDGRARKPIDWVAYMVSFALFIVFFVYIWWAFL